MSNETVPFSLDGRTTVRLVNYVENEIFVQMKSSVTFQLSTGKVKLPPEAICTGMVRFVCQVW